MTYDPDRTRVHLLVAEVGFAAIDAVKKPYDEAEARGAAKAKAKYGPSWRTLSKARAIVANETYKGGVRSRFFGTQRRIYKAMAKLHKKIRKNKWPVRKPLSKVTAADIRTALGITQPVEPPTEQKQTTVHESVEPVPIPERINVRVDSWKHTASGRWRRADTGTWPNWIDRIVIRLPTNTTIGQIRIFAKNADSKTAPDKPLTVNLYSRADNMTMLDFESKKFPRGYGHYVEATWEDLDSFDPTIR